MPTPVPPTQWRLKPQAVVTTYSIDKATDLPQVLEYTPKVFVSSNVDLAVAPDAVTVSFKFDGKRLTTMAEVTDDGSYQVQVKQLSQSLLDFLVKPDRTGATNFDLNKLSGTSFTLSGISVDDGSKKPIDGTLVIKFQEKVEKKEKPAAADQVPPPPAPGAQLDFGPRGPGEVMSTATTELPFRVRRIR